MEVKFASERELLAKLLNLELLDRTDIAITKQHKLEEQLQMMRTDHPFLPEMVNSRHQCLDANEWDNPF
jgi:hypothetical protein